MKLTKLMLSASIAALALVSCNKQDTTPMPSENRLKTVEISLENVVFTKGLAGDKIENGQKINVKNFQIFLTDANGNDYEGKNLEGTDAAKSYWEAADLASGVPAEAAFHYVDPNCTKVVAVANLGKKYNTYKELQAALKTSLEIGTQQDQDALALYAESTNFVANGTHAGDPVEYEQPSYKVSLLLMPRISRFEVDGFSVKFQDPAKPKYNQIKITQLAFQNYFATSNLVTGADATVVAPISDFANQIAVYTWLDGITTPTPWFRDAVDITITPSAAVKDLPADGKLAYHAFSGNQVPVFVLKLIVDGQPAYLYTKNLKNAATGENITEFKEGFIYRMSAQGEAGAGSDGTIEIPEEKLDPMDRCLDISVDVKKWEVVLVTPEF